MDDLINTMTANYGATFTIVAIAIVMVLAITTALLPVFVWSIHNQATRAIKELIRLNRLVEMLILKQPSKDRLKEEAPRERFKEVVSRDRLREEVPKDEKTDEVIEETPKEGQIEPLFKGRLPEPAYRRRKVFYKKDEALLEQKKKTS
jgi:hypothetical protein